MHLFAGLVAPGKGHRQVTGRARVPRRLHVIAAKVAVVPAVPVVAVEIAETAVIELPRFTSAMGER